MSSDVPVPSVDDLADQVADVLDFFRYCVVAWHCSPNAWLLHS
jgi:hypothetical protein